MCDLRNGCVFVFVTNTALAIVDRFTTNVWPRQTYSIGSGSAGSDRLSGYKHDVVARISGRFCLFGFNLLLATRLKSMEVLFAHSFTGRYLLDCRDMVNANIRLHRFNAIALLCHYRAARLVHPLALCDPQTGGTSSQGNL